MVACQNVGRALEYGVAGVGRPSLNRMGRWVRATIPRQPDAPRVDDQPAVSEAHDARDVCVTAQDDRRTDPRGLPLDILDGGRRDEAVAGHPVEPVGLVAARGAVAQEHVVAVEQRRRLACEPVHVAVVEPCKQSPQARTFLDQYPVLVALNRREAAFHQHVGRALRLQRAADMVAEIDDLGDAQVGNVGQHRLQGSGVAVNIGNGGKLHRPASPCGRPKRAVSRECREPVRFSCIC